MYLFYRLLGTSQFFEERGESDFTEHHIIHTWLRNALVILNERAMKESACKLVCWFSVTHCGISAADPVVFKVLVA